MLTLPWEHKMKTFPYFPKVFPKVSRTVNRLRGFQLLGKKSRFSCLQLYSAPYEVCLKVTGVTLTDVWSLRDDCITCDSSFGKMQSNSINSFYKLTCLSGPRVLKKKMQIYEKNPFGHPMNFQFSKLTSVDKNAFYFLFVLLLPLA